MVGLFDGPDALHATTGVKTPKEIVDILKENYCEGCIKYV